MDKNWCKWRRKFLKTIAGCAKNIHSYPTVRAATVRCKIWYRKNFFVIFYVIEIVKNTRYISISQEIKKGVVCPYYSSLAKWSGATRVWSL